MQPRGLMGEKFSAFIRAERDKFAEAVKAAGVVPQ